MNLRMTKKIDVESKAETMGAMIQDNPTLPTARQFTALNPFDTTAMPIIPPMQEWVVDTGRPYKVATISQMATPNKTHIIPNIKIC